MVRQNLPALAAATLGAISLSGMINTTAQAGIVYDDTSTYVTKNLIPADIITGTGVRADHFSTDTELALAGGGLLQVAIKPRNRDIAFNSQANFITSGNYYDVNPGPSSNPARPQLAIDFQFNPGENDNTPYQLRLMVDFNPAPGEAAPSDYSVFQAPIFGGWDVGTDGYFVNGTGGNGYVGAWNNPLVPYVISNTTNLGFLVAPVGFTYDSNVRGVYEMKLEVLDPTGTNILASATAFAVTPEPTSLGLLGVAGIGLLARRRRA